MKFFVCKKKYKSTAGAFSLVETTIVLASMGLILSGLWGLINQGWEISHQELAIGEVITIVNNVRSYYSNQPGVGSGVTTKNLYNAGVFPQGMQMGTYCSAPSVCVDLPWGPQTTAGSVSLASGTIFINGWPAGTAGIECALAGSPAGSFSPYFCVELIVKSQSSCVNLVSSLVAPTGPTGLKAVYINPTPLSAGTTKIRPFNATAASTQCALGTSDAVRYPKQSEITLVYTLTSSP